MKSRKVKRNWRKKPECREIQPVYPEYEEFADLSPKQWRYIKLLPECKTKTEAARRAGFSEKHIAVQITRMYKNERFCEALNRYLSGILEKNQEFLKFRVIRQLDRIAFLDIGNYFDENGDLSLKGKNTSGLASIEKKTVYTKEGATIHQKVTAWNQVGALRELSKILKLYEETENPLTAPITVKNAVFILPAKKTEDEVEKEINKLKCV